MHIVGAILAGGASSRMGTDKSMLSLGGVPTIEHICVNLKVVVDELVVITHKPDQYKFLSTPAYQDLYPGKGPLAGLHAAMYHRPADAYVLAACDMPFFNKEICKFLIEQLPGNEAILPIFDGKRQPLASIVGKEAFPIVEEMLDKDIRKIGLLFEQIKTKKQDSFPFPEEDLFKHFFNMNYPDEYEKAKSVYLK